MPIHMIPFAPTVAMMPGVSEIVVIPLWSVIPAIIAYKMCATWGGVAQALCVVAVLITGWIGLLILWVVRRVLG
ncbi:hypothetical protein [Alienimonas chondri]|uniref:Uncharacterized protein n=1 Tax=Alienimonas chondri TaxID=2681879 RepID=A0ABX1VAW7_9PLAN|nr:hypothetical protein [Alienimonas chondri]NNJ25255.1 hypothetical protein [Alienimonas chondri]